MAGIVNDKLIQDDETQLGQDASQQPSGGTSGVVGGWPGSAGGVSTAGVGAGGTGGWTNIQAYLGANKTNTAAAGLLNDKAGSQYDAENTNLTTQANQTKSQAQGEANKINEAKDKSKEWVNQAANAYSWTGNQNQDYAANAGKLKSAINDQYKGPENFAYQKTADFQKTGAALGDNPSFNNYMNDIYKQKAGGQLSQGMGALQTQLDVNNQSLADARTNMLNKYAGFDKNIEQAVTDSDQAIQKAKTDYGNNQTALKDHLFNMGNEYDTKISQLENDARSAYNTDYSTGKSGLANATNDGGYLGWLSANGIAPSVDPQTYASNRGYWGDNLTWDQLQKEKNAGGQKSSYGVGELQNLIDRQNRNVGALDTFYSQQDQKYANTADSEEKNWNTIMDILGRADKKEQGFKVRGV